jgi:hypothetical protein
VGSAYGQASVYKCTDAAGRVSYSQIACTGSSRQQVINVRENSLDMSALRAKADILRWEQAREDALRAEHRAEIATSPAARTLAGRPDLCDRMMEPLPGARGMTASQRQSVIAACGGIAIPAQQDRGDPASMPAPPPAPSIVTSCDPTGCWDNLGGHYTRGAGNTYFPPSGGACQLLGGQMHCP